MDGVYEYLPEVCCLTSKVSLLCDVIEALLDILYLVLVILFLVIKVQGKEFILVTLRILSSVL